MLLYSATNKASLKLDLIFKIKFQMTDWKVKIISKVLKQYLGVIKGCNKYERSMMNKNNDATNDCDTNETPKCLLKNQQS